MNLASGSFSKGDTGSNGMRGEPRPSGNDGIKGEPGIPGRNGLNGIPGATGLKGDLEHLIWKKMTNVQKTKNIK